jgi:hypothetical protein
MHMDRTMMPRATLPIVIALLLAAYPAGADIYRWLDASGTLHLDDDIANVPEAERHSARIFKAKTVEQPQASGPVQGVFAAALARELGLQVSSSQDPLSVLQIVGIYPSIGWHPQAALSAAVVQEVVTATRAAARAHRLHQSEASAEAALLRVSSALGVAGPPPTAPPEPPPMQPAPSIVFAPNIVVEAAPPTVIVERHEPAPQAVLFGYPFGYPAFIGGVPFAPLPIPRVSGPVPERIPPLFSPAGRLHGPLVTPLESRSFTRPVDF